MSAARFVGIHGDRAVSNSMKSYYDKPVPEIGKIYLINETNEIGEQGSPGRPERLICRPKQYSGYKGCFLLCEYFTAPDRPWHRSFLVEDFRKGLIRIQELKDYIYVNFMNESIFVDGS